MMPGWWLANGNQRRLTGSGSAIQMAAFTLLYKNERYIGILTFIFYLFTVWLNYYCLSFVAVNQVMRVADVTPVAAALLYYPTVQQQQQQSRMRTCSFSSTGSGSTGSAATPPLSPPRPGAFFPPSTVAAKPPSSKPEPPGTGSSGSPIGKTPSPPPVVAARKGSAVAQPARGNIFEHRADLTAFKAIRRAAQNAYHIRLDDDGPHGNDDVRRLLMRRLSAAGVRRFACVACRSSLPVYDEFPLIDGTFFLSPRHYGTSTFTFVEPVLTLKWAQGIILPQDRAIFTYYNGGPIESRI